MAGYILMTRYDWLDQTLRAELNNGAKVVAAYLFARADSKTLECHPKQHTIAEGTGLSPRSVRNAITALRDGGFLVVDRPDAYAVNTYRLTSPQRKQSASLVNQPENQPEGPGESPPTKKS
jgi:hypothetical protein